MAFKLSLNLNLKIIIALVFLISSTAQAQKIKVRQVKGKQALVEVTGGVLVPGQSYEVGDDLGSPLSNIDSRKYFFDLTAGFSSSKSDVVGSNSVTELDLSTTLGWNFGTFELGPSLAFSSYSTGGETTSMFLGGLYGDYNVIPNLSGEPFTYGLSAHVLFGQVTVAKKDLGVMRLQPGVFTKWFVAGTNTGFRVNLAYVYDSYIGEGPGGSASGITGTISLINYF